MAEIFITWIAGNKIELFGAALGILYILFSIRQHILTWPVGLLTSVLYIIVFFRSGFYADMGLQFYYVFISLYGWYHWLKGEKKSAKQDQHLPVKKLPGNLLLKTIIAAVLIYAVLLFILLEFTDSNVPYMDSLTTALSIIATWMLAKKYIEHWCLWVFIDIMSAGLYIYKNLWPTVILFLVYTIMAVIGYLEWKKALK